LYKSCNINHLGITSVISKHPATPDATQDMI